MTVMLACPFALREKATLYKDTFAFPAVHVTTVIACCRHSVSRPYDGSGKAKTACFNTVSRRQRLESSHTHLLKRMPVAQEISL